MASGDVHAERRVTFELVLRQLRKQHFAVLSTVGDAVVSHSAGMSYGVSGPGDALAIYVMTRKHLLKARNIARNPRVSLVIPVVRRFLWFLPPATIQLHGRAEILDWTDEAGTRVFENFWMGRRILAAYRESHRRGETRICFLKSRPSRWSGPTWSPTASGRSSDTWKRRWSASSSRRSTSPRPAPSSP